MSYYVIIRGPAGSGKSTIAKKLAKGLDAFYLDFDKVLSGYKLDKIDGDGISTENFIKGNELILDDIRQRVKSDQTVIIDACFYRKGHLDHLVKSLPYKHFIFSLQSSLEECIQRNRKRKKGMADQDIIDVYNLVAKYKTGILIIIEGRKEKDVINEILEYLKK